MTLFIIILFEDVTTTLHCFRKVSMASLFVRVKTNGDSVTLLVNVSYFYCCCHFVSVSGILIYARVTYVQVIVSFWRHEFIFINIVILYENTHRGISWVDIYAVFNSISDIKRWLNLALVVVTLYFETNWIVFEPGLKSKTIGEKALFVTD